MGDGCGALQRANRASRYANTLAIDANGLQIHVLFATSRNIGVTARVGAVSALASELIDA